MQLDNRVQVGVPRLEVGSPRQKVTLRRTRTAFTALQLLALTLLELELMRL